VSSCQGPSYQDPSCGTMAAASGPAGNTIRQLVNFGFSEAKAREAVESIGNPGDMEAATNWLLDHGEEDRGGAVEFKYCPHIGDLGPDALVAKEGLRFDFAPNKSNRRPCLQGCPGKENWMCLQCGETNCGRYGNKHSLGHWQKTKR